MKKTIFILTLMLAKFSWAQYGITGTYNTTFGEIKIVHEKNNLDNSFVIYGDYRDLGTIISTEVNSNSIGNNITVRGKFTNGNKEGSFEWTFVENFQKYYKSFNGKWGWGSSLNGGEWKGTKKENTFLPTDIKYAQWSGEWDTSFKKIFLYQKGNSVTGQYRELGKISGTVSGNTLKGTFDNKGTKGSFEFVLDGNKFTGKWGWGNKLDQGAWNGTKMLKTNASTALATNTPKELRYRLTLDKIYVNTVDDGPEGIFAGYELFGMAWCRAYDATGKQIQPFDVTYADQYGRFWEIKPQDYIKTDLSSGSQYEIGKQITFDFPTTNSSNVNDFMKKSNIELTVELKDYDSASSVDILGKERVVISLDEATIPKKAQNYIPKSDSKGVINIKHGKGHIMVTYHIEKI